MGSKAEITADDILAHLQDMYADTNQYVCAAEVSPRTGAWERRIDFLVMNCYDSEQLKIQGYEIKISKPDLKRELEDPDKHAVFFDAIDFYWMIAPDDVLDQKIIDLIPPKWGIRKVSRGEDGKIASRTVRKPTCLHDEQMYSRKIRKSFMASFCRAIGKQSLTKRRLLQEQRGLEEEIRKKVESELAHGARIVPDWKLDSLERCKALVDKIGLNEYLSESSIKKFKDAYRLMTHIRSAEDYLNDAKKDIGRALIAMRDLTEGNGKEIGNELQGDDQHRRDG